MTVGALGLKRALKSLMMGLDETFGQREGDMEQSMADVEMIGLASVE